MLQNAFAQQQSALGTSDITPIDVPSLEERFNPGKVFPGGAVHGEAYGITDKSFRPTGTQDWQ